MLRSRLWRSKRGRRIGGRNCASVSLEFCKREEEGFAQTVAFELGLKGEEAIAREEEGKGHLRAGPGMCQPQRRDTEGPCSCPGVVRDTSRGPSRREGKFPTEMGRWAPAPHSPRPVLPSHSFSPAGPGRHAGFRPLAWAVAWLWAGGFSSAQLRP